MDLDEQMTGAEALIRTLEEEQIDTIFGTAGHGNLAFVDALIDSGIRYVSVHHEQVAIHAADAYFRVSGRLAAVTTTVGPGYTNLATGLGDALLDSSAVLVIAGGVPTSHVGLEPLQELSEHVDDAQAEIFRHLSKRVAKALHAADLPREARRLVHRALSDRPGPVILHVPLDLFSAPVSVPASLPRTWATLRTRPDHLQMQTAVRLIAESHRPLLYVGGGAIASGARDAVTRLVDSFGIPIVTTMSGQGAIREDHGLSLGFSGVVGSRAANEAVREADLMIAVGTRFPEMDASSWRADTFASIPPTKLVHIDVDSAQIGKIFPSDVALVGDARTALLELVDLLEETLGADSRWSEWTVRARSFKAAWGEELAAAQRDDAFPYQPAHLLAELRRELPEDVLLVTGVGIRHAVGQHFPILRERGQVVASGFGTMGQEMAAPIGVRLAQPADPVVALVGDGAYMACLAAIPTAVANGIHAVWIVLNNGGYASIAIYQSKHYGRLHGTYFTNVDGSNYEPSYAEIARSFGARGVTVEAPEDFGRALRQALEEPASWVIEVPVTPHPSISASGHWDVNDILAGRGAERPLVPTMPEVS